MPPGRRCVPCVEDKDLHLGTAARQHTSRHAWDAGCAIVSCTLLMLCKVTSGMLGFRVCSVCTTGLQFLGCLHLCTAPLARHCKSCSQPCTG